MQSTIEHSAASGAAGASNPAPSALPVVVAALAGGAVATALGVYGNLHSPTGAGITTFGFPAVLPMKAWFTTAAATLGLVQLGLALWMWGRLPGLGAAPHSAVQAHRWFGMTAFLATLPVAYHCLWALGYQDYSTRVLLHSILGCAFYGIFATKMLAIHSKRMPGWAVPLFGGLLVAVLTAIWFSSSLWFFQNSGFPGV